MRVFFAALKEKNLEQTAISSIEAIHYMAGKSNYVRLSMAAQRTDTARNILVNAFLGEATEPDDVLVMLDYDHNHPIDIIDRLVAHNLDVVGALAFRRGEPFFPCAFFAQADGTLKHPETWEPKVYRCDAIGTAAIAIRRRVFDKFDSLNFMQAWFRFSYPEGSPVHPSEDMYFSHCCNIAGVPIHCDMGLITPHLSIGQIDASTWHQWLSDNPTKFREKTFYAPESERIVK